MKRDKETKEVISDTELLVLVLGLRFTAVNTDEVWLGVSCLILATILMTGWIIEKLIKTYGK